MIDTETATSLNLTHSPALEEWVPSWSSDGKHIVFQTDDPYTRKAWIESVASDGSDMQILTEPDGDSYDVHPQWSPDNQYILFQRRSGYKGLASTLYLMNADGTNLHALNQTITDASWRPISST